METVTISGFSVLTRVFGALDIFSEGRMLRLQGQFQVHPSQKNKRPTSTPIRLQCPPADTSSYVSLSRKKCPTAHPGAQNSAGWHWKDFRAEMTWPQ